MFFFLKFLFVCYVYMPALHLCGGTNLGAGVVVGYGEGDGLELMFLKFITRVAILSLLA